MILFYDYFVFNYYSTNVGFISLWDLRFLLFELLVTILVNFSYCSIGCDILFCYVYFIIRNP